MYKFCSCCVRYCMRMNNIWKEKWIKPFWNAFELIHMIKVQLYSLSYLGSWSLFVTSIAVLLFIKAWDVCIFPFVYQYVLSLDPPFNAPVDLFNGVPSFGCVRVRKCMHNACRLCGYTLDQVIWAFLSTQARCINVPCVFSFLPQLAVTFTFRKVNLIFCSSLQGMKIVKLSVAVN